MFIVAQPKAASQSFVAALRDLTGRRRRLANVPALNALLGTRQRRRHTRVLPWVTAWKNGITFTEAALVGLMNDPIIRSLHIPPTPHNRSIFESSLPQCVVLLRSPPTESLEAYQRRFLQPGIPLSPELVFRFSVLIEIFHYEWLALAQKLGYHVVQFHDLIREPQRVINETLQYLQWPERAPMGFSLPRKNFSGYSAQRLKEGHQCS